MSDVKVKVKVHHITPKGGNSTRCG